MPVAAACLHTHTHPTCQPTWCADLTTGTVVVTETEKGTETGTAGPAAAAAGAANETATGQSVTHPGHLNPGSACLPACSLVWLGGVSTFAACFRILTSPVLWRCCHVTTCMHSALASSYRECSLVGLLLVAVVWF